MDHTGSVKKDLFREAQLKRLVYTRSIKIFKLALKAK